MKTRTRLKQHDPPEILKQYRLKPYTKVPDNPAGLKAKAEDQPSIETNSVGPESNKPEKNVNADTDKAGLVRGMSWEHPTITMDVGTLSVNIKRAMGESPLVSEVKSCLKDAVRLAFESKRRGQQIIGQYVEAIFATGAELSSIDRDILNSMCPSVSSRQPKSANSDYLQFHTSLLSYILTGNPPSTKFKAGLHVQQFIARTRDLGLSFDRSPFVTRHSFPPSALLRSVAAELFREVRKLYKNGSIELEKKLRTLKEKGLVSEEHSRIRQNIPTIENFVCLNRSSKSFRRIVPLSSAEQPFVLFSERELCILFWKNGALRDSLRKLVLVTYKDKTIVPSQADVLDWLAHESPGSVITSMLSHIGKGIPRKKARGFVRSASVMDLEKMRSHLQNIQRPDFDPKTYKDRGYVHHGSIRTDGFRLQLLAFKLKELKSVRYKRLRADVLPLRINSTTGGVDYFLTEIRNVVKTPQDVANLWECEPDDIKILGIALGQACVVGASAILPRMSKMKTPHPDAKMETDSGTNTSTEPLIFRNLVVKQKAVYQPNFKHRRWMETEKNKDPGNGLKTIQDIETELPRLFGEGASLAAYH
ncbi:MAG: hypothetical protein J3Q66DRAFT_367938 [Benniella sp.]|nr:MAG: hypothetical protein J3Q66DRAFT_367938 [Benniella sp.]